MRKELDPNTRKRIAERIRELRRSCRARVTPKKYLDGFVDGVHEVMDWEWTANKGRN